MEAVAASALTGYCGHQVLRLCVAPHGLCKIGYCYCGQSADCFCSLPFHFFLFASIITACCLVPIYRYLHSFLVFCYILVWQPLPPFLQLCSQWSVGCCTCHLANYYFHTLCCRWVASLGCALFLDIAPGHSPYMHLTNSVPVLLEVKWYVHAR
jgi:hypothetical protein